MASTGFEHMLTNAGRLEQPEQGRRGIASPNERTVRRLVTVITALSVIFIALLVVVVFTSLSSHRQHLRLQQMDSLLHIASSGLRELERSMDTVRAPLADDLKRILPAWALDERRVFVIVNADGVVHVTVGQVPAGLNLQEGSELPEAVRHVALEQTSHKPRISSVYLPQGLQLLVASQPLSRWPGSLLLLQPADAPTPLDANTTALLGGLIGLIVILVVLLVLYNWQADQTAEENNNHIDFINRLETALELGRCGLWDWDVARGRIYLTRSMRQLLGLHHADGYMDLADFLQLQHPEERPIDELLEEQLCTGEETFEQELRLRNQRDGTWLWLKLRGALPMVSGSDLHLVGIAIDITAQKRAAADKRDAEQLLDQAISAISESFALWDGGMRLVKCNDKFREFHGLPANACRAGRAYADIMQEATCRCLQRKFRHVLEGPHGRETVMEIELEDGRWLQISERQMAGGGYVSVGTDITELKRKQLELEASRRELEQTVQALEHSQSEIEYKNARLRRLARKYQQEKERAEQALRLKSQILANVSHELFTPLNHIVLSADIMLNDREHKLNDKFAEYARQIVQAGNEMNRKIRDIMFYAELSTQKHQVQHQPLEVEELLAEVVEPFIPRADEKGVRLDWRVAGEMNVKADVSLLSQALNQLLSNAVNFTREGEIVVTAEIRQNDTLVLEVRDTGVGIAEETLAHIGRAFERSGDAYNSHKGGSGIGLAIARTVAEMHGGHMEVESEVGRGTRVRLLIPAGQAATTSTQEAESISEPAE